MELLKLLSKIFLSCQLALYFYGYWDYFRYVERFKAKSNEFGQGGKDKPNILKEEW